jgi:hypothetical protein
MKNGESDVFLNAADLPWSQKAGEMTRQAVHWRE